MKSMKLLRSPAGLIASIIVGAALVAAVSAATVLVVVHHQGKMDSAADLATVRREASRHILLPTNEAPALATVTDKAKLTSPFLKKADNGDKVLIYQQNHIAIIYRPSIDRIVAVGPVTIDNPPANAQETN
jgi:hypothetical protein